MKNCYLLKEQAIFQLSADMFAGIFSGGYAVSAGLRKEWDGEGRKGVNVSEPFWEKVILLLGMWLDFHKNLEEAM